MTTIPKISVLLTEINQAEKEKCPFPTGVLQVSLRRLEANLLELQAYAESRVQHRVKVLLPIKANAYGSGILAVGKFAEARNLCAFLGVAHTIEAVLLRKNAVQMPILLMGQARQSREELDFIVRNNIDLAISDSDILDALEKQAAENNRVARIHLDVDTGMGRCGVLYENFRPLLAKIRACKHLALAGVMTHFAVADSAATQEIAFTKQQIRKFETVKQEVQDIFGSGDILFHTANSGGSLEHAESIFDMIRPGIAAYGYPEHSMGLALTPIMDLVSSITLIKTYPKGHSIGYGRTYLTDVDSERIGIVPIGYGDGLSRLLSNTLQPIINGKKTKCVGRISMDQFAVLVDNDTRVGDSVTIIGASGEAKNDASDIARAINTIPYEVICNLGNASRFRHEYVYES